jgi:hypothetical protein
MICVIRGNQMLRIVGQAGIPQAQRTGSCVISHRIKGFPGNKMNMNI